MATVRTALTRFTGLAFALLATGLVPRATLSAQSGTSTISGVVRDATGAPVSGARVAVVNEDTRVGVETVTNEQAIYRASALVPGTYRVEVQADGFELAVRRSITLEVSQT